MSRAALLDCITQYNQMAIDEDDWQRNSESDMAKIWQSDPVKYLCERHRERANRREPTDCIIENLRIERFPSWENQ